MAISLNKLQQENIDQAKEIIEMRVRLEEKIGQEANEMRANISGKIFPKRWTFINVLLFSKYTSIS